MQEEIFGPVLTIYVYPDNEYQQTVSAIERKQKRWNASFVKFPDLISLSSLLFVTPLHLTPSLALCTCISLLSALLLLLSLFRFACDQEAVALGARLLRNASGNFYINDKCTGAVVGMRDKSNLDRASIVSLLRYVFSGQQPFGGARASGTNDKAGASLNLLRWVSARAIKENFLPLTNWKYPHMH